MIGPAVTAVLVAMAIASFSANRAALAEHGTDERNAVTYRAYTGRAAGTVVEATGFGPFAAGDALEAAYDPARPAGPAAPAEVIHRG